MQVDADFREDALDEREQELAERERRVDAREREVAAYVANAQAELKRRESGQVPAPTA